MNTSPPTVDNILEHLEAMYLVRGTINLDKESSTKLISWLKSVSVVLKEQQKLISLLQEVENDRSKDQIHQK